jgi:hypothetical protein
MLWQTLSLLSPEGKAGYVTQTMEAKVAHRLAFEENEDEPS